jgi:dihydrofolate reductase
MQVSVYIAVSLDGFIAREDGGLDWLPGSDPNTEVDNGNNDDHGYVAFMETVDVLVMGRNSYEAVLSFGDWAYGDKPVVVLSSSLKRLPAELPATVSLRDVSPAELVAELARNGARRLYIDGGHTIRRFLRAGLITDMTIFRVPVLLGQGIPLFGALEADIPLVHLETRAYPDGMVESRYQVQSGRDEGAGSQPESGQ